MKYTWCRVGFRSSRIDRCYVPKANICHVKSFQHIAHLSDHRAIFICYNLGNINSSRKIEKGSSIYWKLNSKVLEDVNFDDNFKNIAELLTEEAEDFDNKIDWFDAKFKPAIRQFLQSFSAERQRKRRGHIDTVIYNKHILCKIYTSRNIKHGRFNIYQKSKQ